MSDDNVENLTIRVLQGIRSDLHDLRGDMKALEQATIAGFTGVHQGLERLDTRLEDIRDLAGGHWRDHEARIRRLEGHTGLG